MVSQDVPSELYAQHLTGNPFPAWVMLRVLLETHWPNTFLSAFLLQTPSGISSVQLEKKNGRKRSYELWPLGVTAKWGMHHFLKLYSW